jgi:hypothetical protein
VLDIDYDIYADGEAGLGWLSAGVRVAATDEFRMDDCSSTSSGGWRGWTRRGQTALKAIGLGSYFAGEPDRPRSPPDCRFMECAGWDFQLIGRPVPR